MKKREFFKRFFQPHGVIGLISLIRLIGPIKLIRVIAVMGNYSVRQSPNRGSDLSFCQLIPPFCQRKSGWYGSCERIDERGKKSTQD